MQFEQQMEQSEELLETNERNKEALEEAKRRAQRADNRANAALSQKRQCENQLHQAVAARNAAYQRASQDEEGGSVDSSYDAAVEAAEDALRQANIELHAAKRELIEASEQLQYANTSLEQSSQALYNISFQLQQLSQHYGVQLSRTQELLNTPQGHLAGPLFHSLGIGQERVNNMRQRIAASLGISLAADENPQGGYGVLAKYLSRSGSNTLRRGGGGGGGGGGQANVYFNTPTSGFRKIQGNHSIESDLLLTNPNYSHTDPNSVWNINCQRCVMAYEARRRGYDVEALPVPGGADSLPIMRHREGWPTVFKNPQLIDCSANSGTAAKLNVEEQLEQWGNNCRAIVRVRWRPECGGGGHVFIAERTNGITRFIDPQNNCTDASDYFLDAKGQDLFCMRTDNLEFSDRIKQCCKNTGGTS